jgi:hypothetical protein
MSDDADADRNAKLKAAMRLKDTDLNKGAPQVPCSPMQAPNGRKCRQAMWIQGPTKILVAPLNSQGE